MKALYNAKSDGIELPKCINLFEGSNYFKSSYSKDIIESLIEGIDIDCKIYKKNYGEDELSFDFVDNTDALTLRTIARPLLDLCFEDVEDKDHMFLTNKYNSIIIGNKILPENGRIYYNGLICDENKKEYCDLEDVNVITGQTKLFDVDSYGTTSYPDNATVDFKKGCKILGVNDSEKCEFDDNYIPDSKTNPEKFGLKKLRVYQINSNEFKEGVPNFLYTPVQSLDYVEKNIERGFYCLEGKDMKHDLPLIKILKPIDYASVMIEFFEFNKGFIEGPTDSFQLGEAYFAKYKDMITNEFEENRFATIQEFLCNQQERLVDFLKGQ